MQTARAINLRRGLTVAGVIVALLAAILLYNSIRSAALMPQTYPVLETSRLTIKYHPDAAPCIPELSERLESALDTLLTDLKPAESNRILVTVFPDAKSLHKALGHSQASERLVGVTLNKRFFAIVSPTNPGPQFTYDSLMQVAVHELAHCVTAMVGFPRQTWLREAIACYYGQQCVDPGKLEPFTRSSFSLDELNSGNWVYEIGYYLIEYVVNNWGTEGICKLVRSNGNVEKALGIKLKDFEEGWNSYLVQRSRQG